MTPIERAEARVFDAVDGYRRAFTALVTSEDSPDSRRYIRLEERMDNTLDEVRVAGAALERLRAKGEKRG